MKRKILSLLTSGGEQGAEDVELLAQIIIRDIYVCDWHCRVYVSIGKCTDT